MPWSPWAAPRSALCLHLDLHTHDARKPQQGLLSCRVFIADMQKRCHPHLFTQQLSPSWTLSTPPATDRPSPPPHLFFPPHLILHHPSFQNKLLQTSQAHSGPESLTGSPLQPQPPHRPGRQSHQTQPSPWAAFGLDLEAAAPAPGGLLTLQCRGVCICGDAGCASVCMVPGWRPRVLPPAPPQRPHRTHAHTRAHTQHPTNFSLFQGIPHTSGGLLLSSFALDPADLFRLHQRTHLCPPTTLNFFPSSDTPCLRAFAHAVL